MKKLKVRLLKLHCYPNPDYDHVVISNIIGYLHEEVYCYEHMKYSEIIAKKGIIL